MSSLLEGVCTVKIDKVSELLNHVKGNTGLEETKSYEKMHYAKYGPFTMGEYKYDVRVCPRKDYYLYFYLCFLEHTDTAKFKKCGYIVLMQDNSKSEWTIRTLTKLNAEKDVQFGGFPYVRAPQDLPAIYLGGFLGDSILRWRKDDCLVVKIAFWVFVDDPRVGPEKPVPQPDQKPNQPTNPPPDYMGTLLDDQFADIHFTVKEQTFTAHRAILAARSSVFRSELLALQDSTCCNKLCFSVQNIDALTFKYLLHFIYTDSLPSNFEETPRRYHLMFIAAYHFKIEGLKSICEAKLTKKVTDFIRTTLRQMEDDERCVLKIVQENCNIKPEVITTSTSVTNIGDHLHGDHLHGTSITK